MKSKLVGENQDDLGAIATFDGVSLADIFEEYPTQKRRAESVETHFDESESGLNSNLDDEAINRGIFTEDILANVSGDFASLNFDPPNYAVAEPQTQSSSTSPPGKSTAKKPAYDSLVVLNAYKPRQLPKVNHWQLKKNRKYPAETIKQVKGKHSNCYLVESSCFQIFLPSYYNDANIEPFTPGRKFALVKEANPADRSAQPQYQFYI